MNKKTKQVLEAVLKAEPGIKDIVKNDSKEDSSVSINEIITDYEIYDDYDLSEAAQEKVVKEIYNFLKFEGSELPDGKKDPINEYLEDFILDDIDWDNIETKKDLISLTKETVVNNCEEFGIKSFNDLSAAQKGKVKEYVDDEWESYLASKEDEDEEEYKKGGTISKKEWHSKVKDLLVKFHQKKLNIMSLKIALKQLNPHNYNESKSEHGCYNDWIDTNIEGYEAGDKYLLDLNSSGSILNADDEDEYSIGGNVEYAKGGKVKSDKQEIFDKYIRKKYNEFKSQFSMRGWINDYIRKLPYKKKFSEREWKNTSDGVGANRVMEVLGCDEKFLKGLLVFTTLIKDYEITKDLYTLGASSKSEYEKALKEEALQYEKDWKDYEEYAEKNKSYKDFKELTSIVQSTEKDGKVTNYIKPKLIVGNVSSKLSFFFELDDNVYEVKFLGDDHGGNYIKRIAKLTDVYNHDIEKISPQGLKDFISDGDVNKIGIKPKNDVYSKGGEVNEKASEEEKEATRHGLSLKEYKSLSPGTKAELKAIVHETDKKKTPSRKRPAVKKNGGEVEGNIYKDANKSLNDLKKRFGNPKQEWKRIDGIAVVYTDTRQFFIDIDGNVKSTIFKNGGLMGTLGGPTPYSDSEMRKYVVEPIFGKKYESFIMFDEPVGSYDAAKKKYASDTTGWKSLYRSDSYQGYAEISPDSKVIKAAVLGRGGIIGAIYVKKGPSRKKVAIKKSK